MTRSLTLKFKILGRTWHLRLLTKKKYRKKHGKGSAAMCLGWKRRIDLSPWGFDLETITHEVLHGYLYETTAKQLVESEGQLEEFFCEIIAKRGREVLNLCGKLWRDVRRLTGR